MCYLETSETDENTDIPNFSLWCSNIDNQSGGPKKNWCIRNVDILEDAKNTMDGEKYEQFNSKELSVQKRLSSVCGEFFSSLSISYVDKTTAWRIFQVNVAVTGSWRMAGSVEIERIGRWDSCTAKQKVWCNWDEYLNASNDGHQLSTLEDRIIIMSHFVSPIKSESMRIKLI